VKTALVAVVTGQAYHDYADKLFISAQGRFKPTERVVTMKVPGREGPWPAATMYRHHVMRDLIKGMPDIDYWFLVDADMVITGPVGPEILPTGKGDYALTATLHPGYVGKPEHELPYERRLEAASKVREGEGAIYYCGGFFGGTAYAMRRLCTLTADIIDFDVDRGLTPAWHDESALNAVLAADPPSVTLDPRYCCPANAGWYKATVWPEDYSLDARITAIDKDEATRAAR